MLRKTTLAIYYLPILLVSLSLCLLPSRGDAGNWPQWRGPAGTGVSDETGLPVHWSENSGIVWKCPLPGQGDSTPAIWDQAVFVTTQDGDKLLLLRLDKKTGRIDWTRQVGTGTPDRGTDRPKGSRGKQKFHVLQNMASPSPVTDGEVVIAHFGNGDLAAYDFAGKELWKRNLQQDYAEYTIWWGHANSPVLVGDLVISVCMQDSLADVAEKPALSYLVAHDKRTGAEKWKTLRMTEAKAEECDSYTTPLLHRIKDRTELIVMGGNQIDAYDPANGRQLWYLPGLVGGRTITGPTLGPGLVYATRGMRKDLVAVRLGGAGKLAASAIAWTHTQATPDTPCPVVWQDWLFTVTDNGIAQCFDGRTGKVLWNERLPQGDYKASPIAADGKLYFCNRKGLCTVLEAGPQFKKLAENRLDDELIASPALSDARLFLRGHKALACVGK